MTDMPESVAAVFKEIPNAPAKRLNTIRGIVLAAGAAADVGGLEETLKWGQPSYLPKKKRTGTTVRLGWSASDPDNCALYVHCQTTLVDTFRDRFPDEFQYVDNRAVLIPVAEDFSEIALQQIASLAFTYHRDKS